MKHTLIERAKVVGKTKFGSQINLRPNKSILPAALTPANAFANKADNQLILTDKFGRNFPYLRLSITDICNFSCDYCLPNGYLAPNHNGMAKPKFLSLNEIDNLVTAFAQLGTHKIRLTGGEPTLRRDFTDIVKTISSHQAITKLAFTTNGYKLKQNIHKWRAAGINAINVSIDSLNAERFYKLTGHDRLNDILAGIDTAFDAGFEQVKVNAVLLKDVNDIELDLFLAWVKNTPINVRFIELMQTGDNQNYFDKFHVSAADLRDKLLNQGWQIKPTSADAGPAQLLVHADYVGSIGIIAPYSKDFCTNCNRLRITSKGDLRLCLFGEQGLSIRHLLQHADQLDELKQLILGQLAFKKSSHFLAMGDTGATANLSTIGG
ncbi:MAG: GTP 3',8-cyclase MoaA [Rhizobiales bacterium]|nr:GTP 3',8-cyclase MoaA [Hyphomicrobiales bacterium]NRB15402.1 GTP 3',8-cyclase MoaA [Hyphomicrobiales bacterium]